jgi:hypothetical protein
MPETAEEIKAREEQEKTDLENQKKKDDEVKTKKETYTAAEYGEVLGESIERRKEIKSLRESLKGFEDEKKKKEEKDMELKDLLVKRDTEILDLKNQISQTTLRNEATAQLMEAGFPAKLLKVALPNDLTEDNVTAKVKEFVKEYKEYAVTKDSKKSDSTFTPFQPGTQKKDEKQKPVNKIGLAVEEMLGK